jgi:Ino eighty subunit 1
MSSVYGKGTPNMRINTLLNDETPSVSTPPKGPGRGNWSRNRNNGTAGRNAFKNKLEARGTSQDGTSPSTNAPILSLHTSGPHGFYLPLNGSDPSHKRSRPLTQHQLAVEQFRRKRVEVILDRGLRKQYKVAKRRRERKGAFWLAWLRCKLLPDGYDTDEDEADQASHYGDTDVGVHGKHIPLGFGGLLPVRDAEKVDCGEEAYNRAKIMTRVARRLDRWEGGVEPVKRKKKNGAEPVWRGNDDDRDERGDSQMDYENGDGEMDEYDRELLEAAEADDSEDEQMDDYDRELLEVAEGSGSGQR